MYYGEACECDNFNCPVINGQICNGWSLIYRVSSLYLSSPGHSYNFNNMGMHGLAGDDRARG